MKHKSQANSSNVLSHVSHTNHTQWSKTILPNGVRVVSEEISTAQSFALGIWIDVGSCDEIKNTQKNEHGIAHFIEHLVFRATNQRSSKQIANYLESVGGYINAFTTKDHTCYYTRALTKHFTRSLDLLSDIVVHPVFRPADIEKERSIILDEITSLEDEPEEIINDYLDISLFASHPFAHPISGSARSVGGMNREQITSFHHRTYTARNIIVAATGNISHDAVCEQAEHFLRELPTDAPAPKRSLPKVIAPKTKTLTKSVQQAHYTAGVALPDISDADYYALSALNIILGDGMSSRLNQSIREKRGICYSVYSSVSDMRDCTIFSIYAAMEPKNLEITQTLIMQELRAITEKAVSKSELRRAKEQMKSSLIIGLESLSGRMNLLAKSELYLGRLEDVEEKVAAIDAVNEASILALAQKCLRPEMWHNVVILPK